MIYVLIEMLVRIVPILIDDIQVTDCQYPTHHNVIISLIRQREHNFAGTVKRSTKNSDPD